MPDDQATVAVPLLAGQRWWHPEPAEFGPVHNPSTGEVIAQVAHGTAQDIGNAVAVAQRAFTGEWRKFGPGERAIYSENPGQDLKSGRADSYRPTKIDESWINEQPPDDDNAPAPGAVVRETPTAAPGAQNAPPAPPVKPEE